MVTAVYTGPWSHGILSAPPRVEAISGLVPQGNFVPSRRFQEEGLEALKQSKRGGGAPEEINTLIGAPAVAKQTKPIKSDSLQVQVEPVVPTS